MTQTITLKMKDETKASFSDALLLAKRFTVEYPEKRGRRDGMISVMKDIKGFTVGTFHVYRTDGGTVVVVEI